MNPVCLSPLKFYDDFKKQSHRKSYAYEHISPLVTPVHFIPSFQFVPREQDINSLLEAYLVNIKDDTIASDDLVTSLNDTGFSINTYSGFKVVLYLGYLPIQNNYEGQYYLKLVFDNGAEYFSEVFCFSNALEDYLEIEYWNEAGSFYLKNGIIVFPDYFKFRIFLKTEVGKPEYNFEEESTKRLGYTYVESQVSKKVYKFNVIGPEYLCDALRIVRMCDNKIIKSKDEEYEALTFEIDVDWQTQGDLASINCEFEVDNIITNIGGIIYEPSGDGDFNDDYDEDFNN